MRNYICMLIYAGGWLALLIWHICKHRTFGLTGIIISAYCISSLASFIFYSNTPTFIGERFSWMSFVYLFITNLICIWPLTRYSKSLSSIRVNLGGENKLLYIFLIVCIPIVIEAFFEMLFISVGTNSSRLGMIYDSEVDTVGNQLSFIGRKTCAIIRMLQYAWPILFFVCLLKRGKYIKLAFIPAIAIMVRVLEGYAAAARFVIVVAVMQVLITYFFFRPSLNIFIKRRIDISLLSIGGLLVLFLSYITISRFSDMNTQTDIWTWISLYLGEGSLRFSQYVWNLNTTSAGDTCFSFIKDLLGLETFTDNTSRRDFYEVRLGIPTSIFYTMIGDFYQDLGFVGTIILVIIIYIILNKMLQRIVNKHSFTFVSLFFISIFTLIFLHGFMYYIFKQYPLQMNLFLSFILIYFLGKSEKRQYTVS